jgi:hypothetical protein
LPRLELLEKRELLSGFTAGNLVVTLIGNGTAISSGAAAPVSLEEFTPSGSSVQILALPSSTNGGTTTALTLPQSQFEGFLNRSVDGRYLAVIGENLDSGTANADSSSGGRVIGRINSSGTIDLTTFVPDYSKHEVDGVVSSDGQEFWTNAFTGPSVALNYVPFGNSSSTNSTVLQAFVGNFNTLAIQNGQLYGAPGFSNFNPNVDQVGTGLPTTTGQTVTALPGFPVPSNGPFPSTENFLFFTENSGSTTPDTLYIADSNSPSQGGGLQKWTYNGTNWQLEYTLTAGLSVGLQGLTGKLGDNGHAILYATTGDQTQLVTVTDAGPNSVFTTLATAPANDTFNGVAFAPVAKADATTAGVAANFVNSASGRKVTLTATVVGNSAVASPTGSVTFKDGSTTLGTGTLSTPSGIIGEAFATFTTTTLSVGTHSITAVYGGDGTFGKSSSNAFTETIVAAANTTTTTVTSSANPAAVGAPLTFTATVSGSSTPTGTVTIEANGAPLGVATLSHGTASLTVTGQLFVGTYNITALYGGSSTFGGSVSKALSQQIVLAPTTTTVTSSLSVDILGTPAESDDLTTLTATVTNTTGITPTGTVTFMDGSNELAANVPLDSNGVAIQFVNTPGAPSLGLGSHSITAVYSGDSLNAASTSAAFSQSEVQFGDSLGLTASVSTIKPNTPVTLTATITRENDGSGTAATGTITFYDFGAALGSATVSNGTASLTVPKGLGAGSHILTATYSGDSNFAFSYTTTQIILTAPVAFEAGDVMGVQAGDGFSPYNDTATAVFVDEYSPSGTLIQRLALPQANSGSSTHAVTVGGFDNTTGMLSRSANGLYLTLAGFDTTPGTANPNNTTNRTVARIDGGGTIDTSTVLSGFRSGAAVRGAVSSDGTQFWVTGQGNSSNFGMRYVTLGATSSQAVVTASNSTAFSINYPAIFDNTLYATSSFTGQPFIQINPAGGGLPTSGLPLPNSDMVSPPGLDSASNPGFSGGESQFVFFHRNGSGTAPDTLYVADRSNGLMKFSFNGTSWVKEGTVNLSGVNAGLTGLTGYITSKGNVVLYGSAGSLNGNELVKFTDTAAFNAPINGSFSVLATSAAGSEFRGVAFAPLLSTTTSLQSSVNPSTSGQAVTFTATVSGQDGSTLTGTVTFMDGSTVLGTGTVTGGQATFTTSGLSVGSHSITAIYSGDTFYQTSTSSVLNQVVNAGSNSVPQPSATRGGTDGAITEAVNASLIWVFWAGDGQVIPTHTDDGSSHLGGNGTSGITLGASRQVNETAYRLSAPSNDLVEAKPPAGSAKRLDDLGDQLAGI